ncbi:NAD-dependent protein deacetylase Sirt6 [Harmonia axyridis]|uniref:NAD-dependent protein deacetylase Sirt6 n=1 Tax=Harmonia axyridis TaxID=115357 RepID=UPI001E2792B8|nr:NAD-dependent protein deacetylase Sirt6 [Harmonia axyridis]
MSCNYADGLSEYENKGVLGVPEIFDSPEEVEKKCEELCEMIKNSRHVVVHTGAGISTSAGIPDFRGPHGVWTLEKKGEKPSINISFDEALPTKTHQALKHLVDKGFIRYIVTQNIDGLHLKSGVSRKNLAELHGNMFTEQCNICKSQFVRKNATTTVGQKLLGANCKRVIARGRSCRGKLADTILDWEANLPEEDLEMADYHSSVADLNICLGTTLQIVPSGNLPLRCKKYGGKVAIINLQPTKQDKKADFIMHTYVDEAIEKIMKRLGLEIPEYSKETDPTKFGGEDNKISIPWDIVREDMKEVKDLYDIYCKNFKKKKMLKVAHKREEKKKDENDDSF